MRVLLTNYALDERAGTEMYIRDVALALLRRGHEPIAYSRRLGEVAEELRRLTVPVLDDLGKLTRPPDIIHGHHHLETMTALARFPRTPAVYFCHGWLPDQEAPPRHPRIRRYIAVDDLVRQRLLDECGLTEEQVETHLNFVDLERFHQRSPLPAQPKRALVFSNLVSEDNCLPVLRQACHDLGLHFETIGRSVGNAQEKPEDWLGEYDLVFAKGRAALEAAATGCAVILCDRPGLGHLVTTESFDRSRRFNFGARLLQRPVTLEAVQREIERYDADDASKVTHTLRQQAGLGLAVDRLVSLYDRVVGEVPDSSPSAKEEAAEEEAKAIARYLRWGPLTAGDFFQPERERLQGEVDHARTWAYELHDHLQKAFEERKSLEGHLAHAKSEQQRLASALANAERERLDIAEQRRLDSAEALTALEAAQAEIAQKQARIDELAEWIVTLEQRQEAYIARNEQQQAEIRRLTQEKAELEAELAWIQNSATWRWRERLCNWPWVAAAYRALFARGS